MTFNMTTTPTITSHSTSWVVNTTTVNNTHTITEPAVSGFKYTTFISPELTNPGYTLGDNHSGPCSGHKECQPDPHLEDLDTHRSRLHQHCNSQLHSSSPSSAARSAMHQMARPDSSALGRSHRQRLKGELCQHQETTGRYPSQKSCRD